MGSDIVPGSMARIKVIGVGGGGCLGLVILAGVATVSASSVF